MKKKMRKIYKTDAYQRAEELARYIILTGDTVRGAAKKFSVSKSTVHKDITQKLAETSPQLFSEVEKILERNKSERHIRGGIATREKYLRVRNKSLR